MKVIEKIHESLVDEKNVVFSFEFFPLKTEDGVENLLERMDRMVSHDPAFCDALRAGQPLRQNRRHRHHKMLVGQQHIQIAIWVGSILLDFIWVEFLWRNFHSHPSGQSGEIGLVHQLRLLQAVGEAVLLLLKLDVAEEELSVLTCHQLVFEVCSAIRMVVPAVFASKIGLFLGD
ncbi:hypothetical protein ACFX15_031783 [Malus domestica]